MNAYHRVKQTIRDVRYFGFPFLKYHLASDGVVDVGVQGVGQLRLRRRDSDADTIRQVFRDREYDISGFPHGPYVQRRYEALLQQGLTPIIIDAGANIGAASLWFAKLFPQAKVIAVEPDPGNALLCRHNTSGLANISVIESAIGPRSGSVKLHSSPGAGWGTRTEYAVGDEGQVSVRGIEEIVMEQGPLARLFIAKVDIEGFEDDLFSENVGWVANTDVIFIEPHDWMLAGRGSSSSFRKAIGSDSHELLILGENLVFVSKAILARPQETKAPL